MTDNKKSPESSLRKEEEVSSWSKFMNYLSDSFLVLGALPVIILFFEGWVTSILLMTEWYDYQTWILTKKAAKILSGGNSNDISDMLKWHMIGSAISAFVFVIFYYQALIGFIPYIYRASGIFLSIWWGIMLIFNAIATYWLSANDCSDTTYYIMSSVNDALIFGISLFSLIGCFLMALIGIWVNSSPKPRVAASDTPGERLNSSVPIRDHARSDDDRTADQHRRPNGNTWEDKKESDKSKVGNSWDNINDQNEQGEENNEGDEEEVY